MLPPLAYSSRVAQDDAQRREYILNESGLIFDNPTSAWTGKPWDFSQFSKPVLDCALLLLARTKPAERADPVLLVRRVSALVNSQDDEGLLVGNWSGEVSRAVLVLVVATRRFIAIS